MGGVLILVYADDTKFYKVIRSSADRKILQENIYNLNTWAGNEGLKLNPKKTTFLSYGQNKVPTIYFLGTEEITKARTVRDLGIHFDDSLNFKFHTSQLVMKISQMIGSARRMVKGIGFHMLMINIFKTYILPIIDYGSVICNQNPSGINTQIEKAYHQATRIALNSPYDVRNENYISYDKCLEILNLPGLDLRLK